MPHHRSLAPPADARSDGVPRIHSELRAHYDAIYDLLLAGRSPRETGLALDLGSGDGATLGAIALGTGLRGVAVERTPTEHWLGPDGWDVIQADGSRLPFADNAFGATLMVDVLEWLRHPEAVLTEVGRTTSGPIVIVQTDWEGLWFECEEAETGRELTRMFTSGAPTSLATSLAASLRDLALASRSRTSVTIRSERLEPGTLAWDVLATMRRWLVIEHASIRARRFDDWLSELRSAAAEGQFSMLLRRLIWVVEGTGRSSSSVM